MYSCDRILFVGRKKPMSEVDTKKLPPPRVAVEEPEQHPSVLSFKYGKHVGTYESFKSARESADREPLFVADKPKT
jgi:hypothetical protein